ncbi:MAG TPA: hypothetical protein VJA00_00200, partial [Candidatus Omnitrophota bacterium]|nr:hypothetical protein [Candidatus Omnitrophota bacterium]
MTYHREDGHRAELQQGDLFAYLTDVQSGRYTLDEMARFLKFDGLIIDWEQTLVERLAKEFNPEVANQYPLMSPSQRFGLAVRLYEIGGNEKQLADWFNDIYEIQRLAWNHLVDDRIPEEQARHRFIDPEVISAAIKQARKDQPKLNPVLIMQLGRRFETIFMTDRSYMPMGKQGDTTRRIYHVFRELENETLEPDELTKYIELWDQLEKELVAQGMATGKIMALQREFSDRLVRVKRDYLDLVGKVVKQIDPTVPLSEELSDELTSLEEQMAPLILAFIANQEIRLKEVEHIRADYFREESILREYRVQANEDRKARLARYETELKTLAERKELGDRLAERAKELYETEEREVDLSRGQKDFLVTEMRDRGYSEDEALMLFADLKHRIKTELYGDKLLKTKEDGYVSGIASELFDRWGIVNPAHRSEIEAKLGYTIEVGLQKDIERIKKVFGYQTDIQKIFTGDILPEYKIANIASNAAQGAIQIWEIENWHKTFEFMREFAKKAGMNVEDPAVRAELLFIADAWFQLGLADLPEETPADHQAMLTAAVEAFQRIDLTQLGRAEHWLEGQRFVDAEGKPTPLLESIVKEAEARKLKPQDLTAIVNQVEALRAWLQDAHEKTKVEFGTPNFFRQMVNKDTIPQGIETLSEAELLLYFDAINPDPRKQLGILEILRDELGEEPPAEGQRPET